MEYKLTWKPEAKQEFYKLDNAIKRLAISQFIKLRKFSQLGVSLGHKVGLDLTGYNKIYFFKKKYRIVYKIDEGKKTVIIFAIGKRKDIAVYKQALKRIESMSN